MTREEYMAAAKNAVYLAACMVNREKPSADRINSMDLTRLYNVADRHLLTGIVGYALEEAGVQSHDFIQAKSKAIRKVLLFDTELAAVLQKFEDAAIPSMPLKGSVLKELYPKIGMRQMADCDVLIDETRAGDVRAIMENLGFTTKSFGAGSHDTYHKQPVYNFEIHRELFGESHQESLREYYRNIRSHLLKDRENKFGYHLSPEDFYIYMIAHEYKHFTGSGTGLRSLLDIYVFLKKHSDTLDFSYIETEIRKLGIDSFEQRNRNLALRLFNNDPLPEEEEEMLEYIILSGVYGTINHRVNNTVEKLGGGAKGKLRYLLRRAFLPVKSIKGTYPVVYKYKILLPFFYIYRLGKGLLFRQSTIKAELKSLKQKKQ